MAVVKPTIATDIVVAASTTSTQTATDTLCGYVDEDRVSIASEASTRSAADATLTTNVSTVTSAHAATKAATKAFFEALQAALPSLKSRLDQMDGTLATLITATNNVVTALS